ncbi:hypothetical protein GpartN1_g3039.t1 [Galdieria partita]|uniref:Target of rapamycin complex subunit LST8 n=1 Tax=Galdieria partita TaxID=83374 RepID=A0A9C7PUT0_9RHOD|nr:hypothetical protein GpartN1_g3039.t1 [Galdieria partita]
MSLRVVSGGYDHTVRLWDAAVGTNDQTFQFNESQVNQVQFSLDGRLVAVCGNPRVCFYDIQSGSTSPVLSLEYHRNNVSQLVFNESVPLALTCSEDSWLCEWDMRSSEPLRSCKSDGCLSGVVYGKAKDECFTCDYGGSIKIWSLENKQVVARLVFGDQEILSGMVFDPLYHLVASTGNSGYGYLCRVETEEDDKGAGNTKDESTMSNQTDDGYFSRVTKLRCSKRYVLKARFNHDASLLVSAGDDGNIRVWGDEQVTDRYQEQRWQTSRLVGKHQKWAWDCCFTRDTRYVFSASSDKRICLWDIETGDLMKEYKGHQKAITSIDTFPTTTRRN